MKVPEELSTHFPSMKRPVLMVVCPLKKSLSNSCEKTAGMLRSKVERGVEVVRETIENR